MLHNSQFCRKDWLGDNMKSPAAASDAKLVDSKLRSQVKA